MPVSTKLVCTHCGSSLKTTSEVMPGAKVRCPSCKGVFHAPKPGQNGTPETIPLEFDLDAVEVEMSSASPPAKLMKSGKREPIVASEPAPARPPGPLPSASKKIEYGGGSVPFRGTRTIAAAICALVGLVFAGGIGWWYLGTVKSLDTAADVAVERRKDAIEKRAAPPAIGKPTPRPAEVAKSAATAAPVVDTRVTAPATAEINEMIVGIVSARLGPIDAGDAREVLTLALRITNSAAKPMTYSGWTKPELKVTLRDMYGNDFKRVARDTVGTETAVKPGETISDRLIFERTSFLAELNLDLPLAGSERAFKFRILPAFIERPGGPPAVAAGRNSTQQMIDAAAGSRTPVIPGTAQATTPPPEPSKPAASQPYDPEQDEKLCKKIRSDYVEQMAEINRRKVGLSTSEGTSFKRRETAKLLKRIAEDNELTDEQVKRIINKK
jgi:hypothetical protein